ncbi:MAG: acyltransferase domain-containing protein, partial [Pseudonocardiaceae bacterium]
LSAKSPEALQESAERLKAHLEEDPEQDLADVAYSLLATRSTFAHKAVAVGESREQLLGALAAIAGEADSASVARGMAREPQPPVFCFPGQGSQWQGMAARLIDESPLFERHIAECEEALSPHIEFSLRDVLLGKPDAASADRIEVIQPALFATMVALARLWEACGAVPAATVGHSQGEIAAAHIAGALCLQDAARIAALRSQLIARLAGKGAMLSIARGADGLEELLSPYAGQIEIAARNGPSSTILSAQSDAAAELLAKCEQEGIRAKQIPATIPSHSAMVEPLEEELLEALAPISPQSAKVPFHSTVAGGPIEASELSAEYWYRNLRQPVLFEDAIAELARSGQFAFIEISPHPVFALPVQETLEANLKDPSRAAVIGTLRREEGGAERFCLSLAQAHANGAKIQWPAFFKGTGAKKTKLPTYPFQRKRYWLSATSGATDARSIGQSDADHPLLGAALPIAGGEQMLFTGRLSLQTHPWLADHALAGTVLLPGTAFLELALRAAEQLGAQQVAELTLQAPLILAEAGAAQIQVSVASPDEEGARQIQIHSRAEATEGEEAEWALNAEGLLSE